MYKLTKKQTQKAINYLAPLVERKGKESRFYDREDVTGFIDRLNEALTENKNSPIFMQWDTSLPNCYKYQTSAVRMWAFNDAQGHVYIGGEHIWNYYGGRVSWGYRGGHRQHRSDFRKGIIQKRYGFKIK